MLKHFVFIDVTFFSVAKPALYNVCLNTSLSRTENIWNSGTSNSILETVTKLVYK